jgi:hypothetical protein
MADHITPEQFDYKWFKTLQVQKRNVGNPGSRSKIKYLDIITAFDIETTYIKDIEQSIMYVWAWQFGDKCTVIGRTWREFNDFAYMLSTVLKDDAKLVTFVHNLSYEFQFLRGIYKFTPEEVFAIKNRKVLKISMLNCIEMRCSYMHANMSLDVYTHKMGAKHAKLSGAEFDYNVIRYPWTDLSENELNYVVNDVYGLVEAIQIEMDHDNDNLYSFPLTSTGYVRRDAKKAMRFVSHKYIKNQLPDFRIYEMLREAFRGGNTHANRYYAGIILDNVKSADITSSYPAKQVNCYYPVTEFMHIGGCTFDDLIKLIKVRKKAVIMRVSMTNVRLKNKYWGSPYIPRDKTRNIRGGVYDNGRVLEAEYLEISLTDIDLKIILSEYDFDDFVAMEVAHARYGKLPPMLIEETIKYFEAKTTLKDVEGQELHYMKSKNKLNSIYGMMAQDLVKQSVLFENEEFEEQEEDPEELLQKSNRKAFLAYQWGVWVTAHARQQLEEGIRLAGEGFVYCDTDSVKYIGEIDWQQYNQKYIEQSKESGAVARDPSGKLHYMGTFEYEGQYEQFITLGAKKYCCTVDGKTLTTIAGVNKKKGGQELDEHGGIAAFAPGFVFIKAGGLDAIYNDDPEVKRYKVDGHEIKITSNVVLRPGVYTLGITAEYERLLEISANLLDL